ncbi:MAG TPA: ELWxxDGT repeat protein [Caulifigura sp.]|nr:ELWxxDGT repeat protein [Caulifigura sp.]
MLKLPFGRWVQRLRRSGSARARRPKQWATASQIVTLEGRLLLTVLADTGNPGHFTAVGSQVFFSEEISTGERRLGVTDGTAGGTLALAAFKPGSYLQDFHELNGKLYFVADDGVSGYELWMSDGTAAGTQMVLDLNPGAGSACEPDFTDGQIRTAVANGFLYFGADDGVHGRELWKTDGTAAGTVMVKDIRPGSGQGQIGEVLAIGNTVYFTGSANSSTVWDLWKTDGTEAGTVQVKDLPATGPPSNLTNVNGMLYFSSRQTPTGTWTLWKSDGTTAGTVNVVGPTLGLASPLPEPIINGPLYYPYLGRPFGVLNSSIIFAAYPSVGNVELWISDGTAAGTTLLKEIESQPSFGSSPRDFLTIGGTLYFSAEEFTNGRELWKTDGTTAGTVLVRNIMPGSDWSNPRYFVDFGGTAYFGAQGSSGLWKTNGTLAGTVGVRGVQVKDLTVIGGKMYFNGNGELWVSDGTTAGTNLLRDLTDPALPGNHLAPTSISLSKTSMIERASIGATVGLIISKDPEAGDTLTFDLVSGPGSDDNAQFSILGNQLRTAAVFDFETRDSYSIRLRSTDPWGLSIEKVFTITVTDVNEKPSVGLTGVTSTLPENTATPVAVANVVITDDALGTNNLTLSGPDAAEFEIVGGELRLIGGLVLDYESGKTSYAVTVNVDDPSVAGIESSVDLLLAVADVSEFGVSTISDTDPLPETVAENAAAGTPVGITAFATDDDGSMNGVTYSLLNSAGGRFAIDPVSGQVTVLDGSLLDRETAASHEIIVRAVSEDFSYRDQSFVIAVTDVDEFLLGPVDDLDPAPNEIFEGAAIGTPVGITGFAVDPDATAAPATYELTADGGGRFAIHPVTGVVTVAKGGVWLDREAAAAWSITIRARAQDGRTRQRAYTIRLLDVQDSPVGAISDINPAVNGLKENASAGTLVGITARAVDADLTNNAVTYSLTADAGGRFAIDPVTGVVTVAKGGAWLDREQVAFWSITVKATSQDGSTNAKAWSIALDDVNEFKLGGITDASGTANSVAENAITGTAVGITALATDADATATVTYSMIDSAGGRFAIHPTSGIVTVADGSLLDREQARSWNISVLAVSSDGSKNSKAFSIAIEDVNEFKLSGIVDSNTAAPNVVTENAANGALVGITAFASDGDATNNSVTYSLLDTAGGRFAIHATTGVITVANGALLDYEQAKFWAISVLAVSSDGSKNSKAFAIAVGDVAGA